MHLFLLIFINGSLKLSLHYNRHIPLKDPANVPDPYVKLYLLPGRSKDSKRKTVVSKIRKSSICTNIFLTTSTPCLAIVVFVVCSLLDDLFYHLRTYLIPKCPQQRCSCFIEKFWKNRAARMSRHAASSLRGHFGALSLKSCINVSVFRAI